MRSLAGAGAAAVAVRTFPFRVYSFPSIIRPNPFDLRLQGYIEWDSQRLCWYLSPEQAAAFDELAVKIETAFYTDSMAGIRYTREGKRILARPGITIADIDRAQYEKFFVRGEWKP